MRRQRTESDDGEQKKTAKRTIERQKEQGDREENKTMEMRTSRRERYVTEISGKQTRQENDDQDDDEAAEEAPEQGEGEGQFVGRAGADDASFAERGRGRGRGRAPGGACSCGRGGSGPNHRRSAGRRGRGGGHGRAEGAGERHVEAVSNRGPRLSGGGRPMRQKTSGASTSRSSRDITRVAAAAVRGAEAVSGVGRRRRR
ncbi:Protein of unknown function [Gryllus bimaculatus]|nr:Protein of unknown function [Gryllus bimaculatus]